MARTTLLDYCVNENTKPPQKEKAEDRSPQVTSSKQQETKASIKRIKLERTPFPPIAPRNLPPSYFVSASYDGKQKKAVIKLYEPESGEIYFWYDNTGHLPYLLTNLSEYELGKIDRVINHEGFDHFESEEKLDTLVDKKVTVTKVVCKDPLAIGGRPGESCTSTCGDG